MASAGLGRRRFLALSGASLAAPFVCRGLAAASAELFALGVASGAPRPDGIVLWTRLDLPAGSGPVEVEWELASDERFRVIAARGRGFALPENAHSIHIDLSGLGPDRWYWYRFTAAGVRSRTGRTRTAPAPGSSRPIRFAVASCQNWEQGYFTAWWHIAREDLDLIVHLGDYIYENSWGKTKVRRHGSGAPTTLAEYRERYALYKSDPDLQDAHAAFPFLSVWDDHEVVNDYQNDRSDGTPDPAAFLRRRAAAYKAYYEHMPMPASAEPRGPDALIYGTYRFGEGLEILLLDDRQYRSAHACRPARVADCAERLDPARTMLGVAQERWLRDSLARRSCRWTMIAQQTRIAELDLGKPEEPSFWLDGWDGYPAARRRLMDAIAEAHPANPLVLGGDVHSFWVADLHQDFRRPGPAPLATEIVGTSITSEGPSDASVKRALARNPHLKYGRADKRGYVSMIAGGSVSTARLMAVDDPTDAGSGISELARFAIEDGRPGAQAA